MSCALTKWLDAQTRYSFDDFYIDFKAATLDYARWALWQNLVPGRLASLCARHAVLPAQRTTNERFSIVLAGIMARSTMQLECLAYLLMYHRKQNWTSSTAREFGVFVRLVVTSNRRRSLGRRGRSCSHGCSRRLRDTSSITTTASVLLNTRTASSSIGCCRPNSSEGNMPAVVIVYFM